MKIEINSQIHLSQITAADKPLLLKYINDKDIYGNTLKIPFPYSEKEADEWISFVDNSKRENGILKHWAIKTGNDELIGGIGFPNKYGHYSHKDEIGYWLAKPFWNKGIMTDVVNKVCSIGFSEFGLVRIEAIVFLKNKASMKVLEKTGFIYEGTLKKFYIKDHNFVDVNIYSRVI